MQPADDEYWRRPHAVTPSPPDTGSPDTGSSGEHRGADEPWRRPGPTPAGADGYLGPPPMSVPPAGWQPAQVVQPASPRPLPPQDHNRIDEDEARARARTRVLATVAAVIAVVVFCVLCGRAVF